jgi:hypothetical protein
MFDSLQFVPYNNLPRIKYTSVLGDDLFNSGHGGPSRYTRRGQLHISAGVLSLRIEVSISTLRIESHSDTLDTKGP